MAEAAPQPAAAPAEPAEKKVVAFVDGQNLFYAAKELWGYDWPNYDIARLARAVCVQHPSNQLVETRLYTGIPLQDRDWNRNMFWQNKLLSVSRTGVKTFKRHLVYRSEEVELSDGTSEWFNYAVEKGIDVRIALDVVRLAHVQAYDVAVIFSQDQDLSEAVEDVRLVAADQGRWIRIASAFPYDPASDRNARGISGTYSLRIDRATYDACIDPRDYRPQVRHPRRPY